MVGSVTHIDPEGILSRYEVLPEFDLENDWLIHSQIFNLYITDFEHNFEDQG